MKGSLKFLNNIALVSQIGIMMALPIIACIWLGGVIDRKLGTHILFLSIFTVLGVGASFRNLYILAMKESAKKRGDDEDE